MLTWWKQFRDASGETKLFALVCFLFGALLVVTTVYCYARLDYVRSYKTPSSEASPKQL